MYCRNKIKTILVANSKLYCFKQNELIVGDVIQIALSVFSRKVSNSVTLCVYSLFHQYFTVAVAMKYIKRIYHVDELRIGKIWGVNLLACTEPWLSLSSIHQHLTYLLPISHCNQMFYVLQSIWHIRFNVTKWGHHNFCKYACKNYSSNRQKWQQDGFSISVKSKDCPVWYTIFYIQKLKDVYHCDNSFVVIGLKQIPCDRVNTDFLPLSDLQIVVRCIFCVCMYVFANSPMGNFA